MATLTETAYYSRRTVNILVVGIIGFVVLKLMFNAGVAVWIILFPPPPLPPNVAFGVLPFPNMAPAVQSSASAQASYSLETIGGGLPKFPVSVKVYSLPQRVVSFGDYDKMIIAAKTLGFLTLPQRVQNKGNIWLFGDGTNPFRHLEYDATTGNFHLYYDFAYDKDLFVRRNFSTKEKIISEAKSYMSSAGLAVDEFEGGDQVLSFFKFEVDHLTPTETFADADMVTVGFRRPNIIQEKNSYPVISADLKQNLVSISFTGNPNKVKRVIEVRYYYSRLDIENFATYPAISSLAAYEVLKNGGAFVTSLSWAQDQNRQISIRKVYMAYLDPFPNQGFIQPVAVFSDEKGFMAYVPVVSENWLRKSNL